MIHSDITCAAEPEVLPVRDQNIHFGSRSEEIEADASYLNNIGDAELRAVWADPEFNPAHASVYYARVLEIPTPTWQAYDSKFFDIEMPPEVPLSHQERAYTSPIWYTP